MNACGRGASRATAMPDGTPQVPVAIVGAGACGLTAALMLRDAGIDCVLLERDAVAARLDRAVVRLHPGRRHRACSARPACIDDSAARFAADIQAKAHGRAAPHLVAAYTEAIAPALDALQQRHGIAFELLDGFLYPGHSVRRMHTLPQRTGAALMAALQARRRTRRRHAAHARARDRRCGATTNDRVLGVTVQRPDGREEHLACDALLLACNGFGGNAAMVREHLPAMRDAVFAGHAGNDGSAIAWGRALDARLADLGGYQGHGSWAVPHGVLITWALMTRRRHPGQRATAAASTTRRAATPKPRSTCWRSPAAWRGTCSTRALLELARGFPDFVERRGRGRGAPARTTQRRWRS